MFIRIFIITNFIFLLLWFSALNAMASVTDSLEQELKAATHDTTKINLLNALFREYIYSGTELALDYAKKANELSNSTGNECGNGLINSQ
ncbi:MAG: hypothetical protein KJ607_11940 [Bacteroidetes bacterium]|nr:hypothetical protein [Bacteroidota bacterium]